MTILVTRLVLAYSAIWPAISSPYTVAAWAPNCSASRRFSLSSALLRSVKSFAPGVSTYSAVKEPRKASAILAAVRITFLLEAADDRQTRM
ncbi:hypothetical protein D3C73_1467880 [compost metagenome]